MYLWKPDPNPPQKKIFTSIYKIVFNILKLYCAPIIKLNTELIRGANVMHYQSIFAKTFSFLPGLLFSLDNDKIISLTAFMITKTILI